MKKSFILTVEEREARNKLVLENRLKRGQIPKFNSTKRVCNRVKNQMSDIFEILEEFQLKHK